MQPAPHAPLGSVPGQTDLLGTAAGVADGKSTLESGRSVLPELDDADIRRRPLWRHPAMLVSIILTVLMLGAAGAFFVIQKMGHDAVPVTELALTPSDSNVHITWKGGDELYSLYSVDGTGTPVDQSVWIRGGKEAWIPATVKAYSAETCFVVRPSSVTDPVSLNAQTLSEQGAQRSCLSS